MVCAAKLAQTHSILTSISAKRAAKISISIKGTKLNQEEKRYSQKAETGLWPNLLLLSADKNIPIYSHPSIKTKLDHIAPVKVSSLFHLFKWF